jgi:hypothetical protein
MRIASRLWGLGLLLLASPLLAAQVTCQNIAGFNASIPTGPDGFLSGNYNVTGFDYYVLYIANRSTNVDLEIDTYEGSDVILTGFWARRWTFANFLSLTQDEHRLVTPAQLVARSPVRVRLVNTGVDELHVWSSQICFGSFGTARSAESWSLEATVAAGLVLAAGAVVLLRRRDRSRQAASGA